MPRTAHAQGRPDTQIMPDRAALMPVAALTRNAIVSLRKPGTSGTEWDPDTEQTVPAPFDPYATDQSARIQAITAGQRTVEVASDTIHVRGYLVTLDAALAPQVDDLIEVTACDDVDLVDQVLEVTDVVRGSTLIERDVFCTLND